MPGITLEVYLFFMGNCREAMEFYKGVFGGELFIQTYDESGQKLEGEFADMSGKVMHASLRSDDIHFMASDSTLHDSFGESFISLALGGTDAEKLRSLLDKLAEGGKVTSPLKKEFWGDTFGSLTDKFGVDWMVNITAEKKE